MCVSDEVMCTAALGTILRSRPRWLCERVHQDGHVGLLILTHIAANHISDVDPNLPSLHQSSRKVTTNKALFHAEEAKTEEKLISEKLISEISQLEAEELDVVKEAIVIAAGELEKLVCRTPEETKAEIARADKAVEYTWKGIHREPASNIRQASTTQYLAQHEKFHESMVSLATNYYSVMR